MKEIDNKRTTSKEKGMFDLGWTSYNGGCREESLVRICNDHQKV